MTDEYSFSDEETSLETIYENTIKYALAYQLDENNHSEYNETIGSIFMNVALEQGDYPAVIQMADNIFEPNTLTYSQIYHQVQMLAHRLIVEYKIKVGDVICQCMERSLDMVIGLLGIMVVGAVYCPLNPTDPKDRLSFVIESTQARLVLIHRPTEHIFQHVNKKTSILIFNYKDSEDLVENNQMKQPALIADCVTGSDIAYIIFTSGSTGKPKGVPISHSNFLNHWRGIHQSQYNDQPLRLYDDVTLAMGLTTFDISLNEILCPLLNGSHFILLPPRGHLDSGYIVNTIAMQQVTQLFVVPSALRTLLDFIEKQQCSYRLTSLRSVWCGGEMVTSQLALQFYRNMPSSSTVEFVNVYGPTECTILTNYHRVTKADIERDLLPIGRPFLNYSCYILDEHYVPVSQGSVGELFIGGQGVFDGYLINGTEEDIARLQTVNAQVLVDIPDLYFQSEENYHNKFYRTGDLCRLNDDGELCFVGRVDHQVKLRGQRLELGEIEACISAVPFVTCCVARKCLDQTTRHEFLAAYVECPSFWSSASSFSMKESIQQHCRSYLPAYMVPSVIVLMDHLPLNGNGKVDRKQLPTPEIDRNITSKYWEYKEPSSELECIVHTHWSTVLGIDQISIYANFFTLGGNSLTLMRLIGDYRTAGLIKSNTISTDQFFKQTTLIEHVHLLEKQSSIDQADNTVDDDPWLPLNHNEAEASAAQQRIWLDEQLRYSKSAKYAMYNVVIPIIVDDNNYTTSKRIELDRIHRALLAIIRRHKVLRTCIRHEMNSISQYVNPMPKYLHPEPYDQFYSFIESAYSTNEELKQILSNEVLEHVFRLEEGLVVRFHLIRQSIENIGKDQLYNGDVMAFNIHHAAIDGESKVLFLRDLQLAYHDEQIFGKQGGEDLFQYIDFSIHESRLLEADSNSSCLSEARAYWKQSLAGCLDKHLSICQSQTLLDKEDGHGNYLFDLSTDLVAELVSLAVKHNLSLYQMCLAAYVLFIHKLTGEQDICVGGVTANRYRPEQDDLIGMFVNLLPYRMKIDNNNDNLQHYYAKIHELCLDFMRYGQLPLQEIVKLHRTSHDQLHHSPFFQTTLAFYSNTAASHLGTYSFDDVLCKSITVPVSVVKFDLCLVVNHTLTNNTESQYQQHNMLCKWEYSTRLYEENDIQILTDRFTSFLTSLIDAEKMTQLSVLISRDFKAIRQLNDTHINFAHSITLPSIHANFDIHVRNNPFKTAVICDGSCFTYHEINQKAIKLASCLLKLYNVRRGDVIMQCVGRGVEMVIGILAILKVQGIYCPLNPADPSQRHISLINDIKARFVLCDRSTYPVFQMNNETTEKDHDPVVLVNVTEVLLSTTETVQSLPQQLTTTEDDLAYIIYTSGSTGKPKAVPISNGNFLACIRGMQHLKMIHSSDTIVQITECSYDVHLMELLGCLVTGGTLIMLKQHGNLDMVYLANIIEQYKATWTILVPTLALSLYEQVSSNIEYSNKLRSLTTCISGGEAMSPSTIKKLLPFFSTNVQVYNVYGPAEASMASTFHLVKSEDLTAKFVPIGRPLPNYSCDILDKDFSPLPVGSVGELFIGGPGVFMGYQGGEHDRLKILNDLALIDIPALHSQLIENRHNKFYRTGDLCRLNDNGEIVFVGRVDDQVKIRGQRLELGEIEACIRTAPSEMNVRNCLVIKYVNDITHQEYLGAYVQLAHGVPPETYTTIQMNLTKYCMQYLPTYMIPTSWLYLDAFPLNSNDKIDRKQLPPFPSRMLESNRKTAVQTSKNSNNLEDLLREIYTSVLNVDIDEKQYHMSFIELGGTSLTAMAIVQLIRQRLCAEMEICVLFKNPSIYALATALHSYQTHVQEIGKCS